MIESRQFDDCEDAAVSVRRQPYGVLAGDFSSIYGVWRREIAVGAADLVDM